MSATTYIDTYLEQYDHFKTKFEGKDIHHYLVGYRCGETINVTPPWIEGRMDRSWKNRKPPELTDKTKCENYIGMKLLPIGERP